MPDPSFLLALVLQSALLPFAVALAVLLVLRRPALAIAAGFLASYFAVFHAQWSALPKQALDWMPWITLVGSAAALAAVRSGKASLRLMLRAAASLGATAVVVWPALASIGVMSALGLSVSSAALILLGWNGVAAGVAQRPWSAPLLMLVAGGAGVALMLDSSQAIGQLSGALAASLAACALLGLMRRRAAFDAAGAGIGILLLGALLTNAFLYAGFPLAYVALLAAALLADVLVSAVRHARGGKQGALSSSIAGVLTALPVLLVLTLAARAAQQAGGY